ncbi:hypothetical protein [Dietzia psychralcaliphila]|uniref:GLTT repeat-containing protein n=2 Tax=Dietzia psychralcaliphila TaxID=139021 RepID=A0AAD0NMK1_9ACTN|nr:hypothetical protein [Dietzia psychralcaliphila]AWH94376.1 hypothetical protein A6048_01305 [Dietzia psychralcaliphila]PTM88001.1 hypothetical protein C8N39_104219 [Dietzia psychralcaliphila]
MTFTIRRAAAVAAATALAISGAAGVATAQDNGTGSLSADSLGADSLGTLSSGSEGSGESAGDGSIPQDLGSLILDANATGEGSLDTSGSAIFGEPSTGSLAPVAGSLIDAAGSITLSDPAPGTGSVDASGSLLDESLVGSVEPAAASVAGSLGVGEGATLVLGSDAGSLPAAGSLGPLVLVGGSAAVIGAGIYFAPQIHQALTDAGIVLPPLPGTPVAPPQAAPAPAPQAPGPDTPNGRG